MLKAYFSGSKIFGQYGDPWDLAVGLGGGSATRQFRMWSAAPGGFTRSTLAPGSKASGAVNPENSRVCTGSPSVWSRSS